MSVEEIHSSLWPLHSVAAFDKQTLTAEPLLELGENVVDANKFFSAYPLINAMRANLAVRLLLRAFSDAEPRQASAACNEQVSYHQSQEKMEGTEIGVLTSG